MRERVMNISFLSLIIGIAATAMIFLPAIKYESIDTVYSGFQATFGVEIVDIGIASGQLEFNVWALLAFGLPAIAGILAVLARKGALISAVLFAVAAILLFTLPQYVNATATGLGGSTDIEIDWVMQYGLILAGSLAILGAGASLFQGISDLREPNSK